MIDPNAIEKADNRSEGIDVAKLFSGRHEDAKMPSSSSIYQKPLSGPQCFTHNRAKFKGEIMSSSCFPDSICSADTTQSNRSRPEKELTNQLADELSKIHPAYLTQNAQVTQPFARTNHNNNLSNSSIIVDECLNVLCSSSRGSLLNPLALSQRDPQVVMEVHGQVKGLRIQEFNIRPKILVLALFLLLLLPNYLVLLLKLPNIRSASAKLYHNTDDGDTDLPAITPVGPDGETENFTQIPFEYSNNNRISTTTTTTTTGSSLMSQRPVVVSASTQRRAPILRITESELLPFTEFTVQQPTFSDLMRSWPPTTQQAVYLATNSESSASSARHNSANRTPASLRAHHKDDYATTNDESSAQLMRNHLNEDLDDTMVTADQGFERDQMPEPPTLINYLGDLGDYIYVQLRQYFDSNGNIAAFSRNGAANGGPNEQTNNSPNQDSSEQPPGRPAKSTQQQQQHQSLRVEAIDELLDDHYYDQYENSQVLYYGPQLVREGDIFEIGCYLPNDHKAEWTKSGRALANKSDLPRVIRQSDFLGAKQNFSLKIFEASMSDSGNYRCDRMSRKYHKLVVVPSKTSTAQLFMIQQRLLSVVNPKLVSLPQSQVVGRALQITNPIQRSSAPTANKQSNRNATKRAGYLLPGYLIVENQPLVVNCNITDEFVLRRLRENPQFQLAWYKNGKQLRGSLTMAGPASQLASSGGGHSTAGHLAPSSPNQSPAAIQVQVSPRQHLGPFQQQPQNQASNTRARQQQLTSSGPSTRPTTANQRIQFSQANGRQLYITSTLYSDAGDYLCSWSKLPARQHQIGADSLEDDLSNSSPDENNRNPQQQQTFAGNPLAAGSLVQLMAPAKLRPFKSTYHVRAGNELRLVCQLQRGYPPAHISWYVGNRLVDAEFLREFGDEFKVLQLQNQNHIIVTSSGSSSESNAAAAAAAAAADTSNGDGNRKRIVEINPIPSSRQQMSLTANGRGQWVEYRDPMDDKYAIETPEQQLRYLQQKLAQLSGLSATATAQSSAPNGAQSPSSAAAAAAGLDGDPTAASLFSQTSISVLVINSLNIDRHKSRYACRATTRTNTDEVTTVIRVQASTTIIARPSSGRATLVPGQPLHFQCEVIGNKNAEFWWYKRPIGEESEDILWPNNDDNIVIHNNRLTLLKPTLSMAGDYVCRGLKEQHKESTDPNEWALIQVRTQPYIEDFGQETSHTGKSATITDGDRLELTCTVRDKQTPVNITWLRSMTPDDERTMVPIFESPSRMSSADPASRPHPSITDDETYIQTLLAEQNIIIETLNSHSKKLRIESVKPEHRSHYVCMVDNGVTERTRKIIFIRVKDRLIALWPFLGIVAELFILFTIIHIWETQRAYKEVRAVTQVSAPNKRLASGPSGAFESAPLTSG